MNDVLKTTLDGLRKALVQSPTNGHLLLQIAEILKALGRDTEAQESARQALHHLNDDEGRARAAAMLPTEDDSQSDDGSVLRLVQGGRRDADEKASTTRESVTFADVGGLDEIKEQIRLKIIVPFERPELFRAYGKKVGGGILLYGPPGCGKTLLARATAGEVSAYFQNVAIDDILDMYYGESERKLASVFETARAKNPSVVFFDEVEAIGGSRQQLRHSPGRTLVNQLLAEMDGLASQNEKILVIAATNAPWSVDAALRRPGRFERVLFVPPPDEVARLDILRLHLRERPVSDDVNLGYLAKKTAAYSGADLHELVERAAEAPLMDAIRSGSIRPIARSDFDRALKTTRPSTREWFSTAKNYATFANTGGLYDELVEYLKKNG